jgi:pimeloyl-ACP methyl ester carboxylesterase
MAGPDGRAVLDNVNSISAAIDQAILAGDHRTAARQFVDYWGEAGAWAAMRSEVQADVIHYMPKACLDFRALKAEPTPLTVYRHFRFPVLLLQGQHTPEPMQFIARRLAKALRFGLPQTLEGAGHMGPLTHAEKVAELVAGFIARQDEGEGGGVVSSALSVRYDRAA